MHRHPQHLFVESQEIEYRCFPPVAPPLFFLLDLAQRHISLLTYSGLVYHTARYETYWVLGFTKMSTNTRFVLFKPDFCV